MPFHASLFSLPLTRSVRADGYVLDGAGRVVPGFLVLGQAPADDTLPERWIVMGEPGRALPGDALAIAADGQTEWTVEELAAAYPDLAPMLLLREYRDARGALGYQRMMEARPEGATVLRENLPPVVWG